MTNKTATPLQVSIFPGWLGVILTLGCLLFTIACPFLDSEVTRDYYDNLSRSFLIGDFFDWLTIPMALVTLMMCFGFEVINPKTAVVFVFLGKCKGVFMENGFIWLNPFVSTNRVSLKIENFNSSEIKVNDKIGSPINVSAVVSCQLVDPEALAFNAQNPKALIHNAIDRVLRKTVSEYPYDLPNEKDQELCLRKDSKEISEKFKQEIQDIVSSIGMEVLDANFNSMSYAPEIAGVMLQRQQAAAMVDARKTMVDGAVGAVKEAISAMEKVEEGRAAIAMSDSQKAQLAANLLTVMVGERGAQVTVPLS